MLNVYASHKAGASDAQWDVPLEEGKGMIRSRSGQQGSYHWVMAREETGNEIRIASTVVAFSNPGPNPQSMLMAEKTELEIIPLKLPREHSDYRATESWPFMVRRNGQPLVDTEVVMQTSQGSSQTYKTDSQGEFDVVFPDDFVEEASSEHAHHGHGAGRKKANFVLGVTAQDGERTLVTAFNYRYRPAPMADKNLPLGIGALLLGMVAATPLLRRNKKARKSS
ncbi:MAG: hypothetical protein R3312_10285, partial [Gammaproteobacteria bacterium]|nr:hypothetical protein [Gammaproteobacteria bacterium]